MPEILVGEYLFLRLKEIGIETIFGVSTDQLVGSAQPLEALGGFDEVKESKFKVCACVS